MNSWTVFFITAYNLLNSAMAWHPHYTLILVGKKNYVDMKFPAHVTWSPEFQTLVYYDTEHPVTYEYSPQTLHPKRFNYPTLLTEVDYREKKRRPKRICHRNQVEYDLEALEGQFGQYIICTHDGENGFKFSFIYRLCRNSTTEQSSLEIYDMCYSMIRKQIIIGTYTIHHPYLLRNPYLQEEQNFEFQFQREPVIDDPSYNEDYFNSMLLLYQDHSYVARSVLPPELLAYALERKPLYNHMNFAPMHVSVIDGWKQMMKNLKRRLSLMHNPVKVTAGIIIKRNSNACLKTIYSQQVDGQQVDKRLQVDIPTHWWVMITSSDDMAGIVIMMRNKWLVVEDRQFYFEQCGSEYCETANLKDLMHNIIGLPENFIYCCNYREIKHQFNLPGIGGLILQFPNEDVGPSS